MKEMVQLTAPELTTPPGAGGAADGFHPAVAEWFRRRFPDGPTEAQAQGWPHIATGAGRGGQFRRGELHHLLHCAARV